MTELALPRGEKALTRRLILGFEKPSEAGSRRFSMPMRGGRTLVMSAPVLCRRFAGEHIHFLQNDQGRTPTPKKNTDNTLKKPLVSGKNTMFVKPYLL